MTVEATAEIDEVTNVNFVRVNVEETEIEIVVAVIGIVVLTSEIMATNAGQMSEVDPVTTIVHFVTVDGDLVTEMNEMIKVRVVRCKIVLEISPMKEIATNIIVATKAVTACHNGVTVHRKWAEISWIKESAIYGQ